MDLPLALLTLVVILASDGLLFWIVRVFQDPDGQEVSLREHAGYDALSKQIVRVVEGGQKIHFSLGRGSLDSASNPASIAALIALNYLEEQAVGGEERTVVSAGDGTLMLSAQDSLRTVSANNGRLDDFFRSGARFVAASDQSMALAGGVSEMINRGDLGSNIMMGRFGSEIAIIGEAAERQDMEQVVGSDDPIAMALSVPITDNLLVGEELFASGAYLEGKPSQIASLQVQDILRVLAAAGIVLAALINLVVG